MFVYTKLISLIIDVEFIRSEAVKLVALFIRFVAFIVGGWKKCCKRSERKKKFGLKE